MRTTLCFLAAAIGVAAACAPARAGGSLAEVDAVARAAGNRPLLARALGDVLFQTSWPAQITKVRVDAVGSHAVAGLVLSGTKFHHPLDRDGFLAEVRDLVAASFAHSPVEEVDLWTTIPLATHAHEVVAGDLAMPTSRNVFAVSVQRREAATFAARLASGRDVFWDAAWRDTLTGR
jgi:hypothetical protein